MLQKNVKKLMFVKFIFFLGYYERYWYFWSVKI